MNDSLSPAKSPANKLNQSVDSLSVNNGITEAYALELLLKSKIRDMMIKNKDAREAKAALGKTGMTDVGLQCHF